MTASTGATTGRPAVPWDRTVIYEAHVRGLSMRRDDLPPRERGTFSALADPRLVDHLHRLGVTAIELLPIHAFAQDRFLVEKGLRNYWGYSTLAFFAPEPRYLVESGARNELKVAVRRLHAAGIEVILDVVYNHTCEGGETGPTLSWRGLDNASYYRLFPGDERRHINDTGTGNTVNLVASARAADGDGQPALLGGAVPHRRLPLRPRHHPRARGRRASIRARASSTRCGRTRCSAA